jgi:mannose-P-dolichol utilization defect protein 1
MYYARILFIMVVLLSFGTLHAFAKSSKAILSKNRSKKQLKLHSQIAKFAILSRSDVILSATAKAVEKISFSQMLAKFLGTCVGIGAMTVYSPIIINLLKSKSAEGYSTQTWIASLMGITLSLAYPVKKGFPLSSFLELLVLPAQAVIILAILSNYNKKMTNFAIGGVLYTIFTTALFKADIPDVFMNNLQIISALVCNYASIPQIILTFQQRKARWSRITATLSLLGNLIRIFTTINLAGGDRFFLFGYILGFTLNTILLVQTFIFPSN